MYSMCVFYLFLFRTTCLSLSLTHSSHTHTHTHTHFLSAFQVCIFLVIQTQSCSPLTTSLVLPCKGNSLTGIQIYTCTLYVMFLSSSNHNSSPSIPPSLPLSFLSSRSAAKAPFLARFSVAKCGTARVEELNTREDAGEFVLYTNFNNCR